MTKPDQVRWYGILAVPFYANAWAESIAIVCQKISNW
jgi:hypothetical protein